MILCSCFLHVLPGVRLSLYHSVSHSHRFWNSFPKSRGSRCTPLKRCVAVEYQLGSVALISSDHEITASPQVPIVACITDINYPNAYLPGHSWELQLRLVINIPVHSLPPCSAGWVTILVPFWIPPPHDFEQLFQVQLLQVQLTERYKFEKIMVWKWAMIQII